MKGDIDYDFIFAFVLFLSMYLSVFNIIPFLTISSNEEPDSLSMEASYLSEQLVKSPGEPFSWNTVSSNENLGLAYYFYTYKPNVLDYSKLLAINGTSCDSLKAKTIMNVNFMINVKTQKATLNCTGTPSSTARLVERIVTVYDGYGYWPGTLQLYVWK
jgi:hypothetical protein